MKAPTVGKTYILQRRVKINPNIKIDYTIQPGYKFMANGYAYYEYVVKVTNVASRVDDEGLHFWYVTYKALDGHCNWGCTRVYTSKAKYDSYGYTLKVKRGLTININ